MAGVFGDIGPGAWALFALLYGVGAAEEAERRIASGTIKTLHELAAWWAKQPVDDRWDPRVNPAP